LSTSQHNVRALSSPLAVNVLVGDQDLESAAALWVGLIVTVVGVAGRCPRCPHGSGLRGRGLLVVTASG
jgi:hypothetical protein